MIDKINQISRLFGKEIKSVKKIDDTSQFGEEKIIKASVKPQIALYS